MKGWAGRADERLLDAMNDAFAGAVDEAAETVREVRVDAEMLREDATRAGRVDEVRELHRMMSRLDVALAWLTKHRNGRRAAGEIAHARAELEDWSRRWG